MSIQNPYPAVSHITLNDIRHMPLEINMPDAVKERIEAEFRKQIDGCPDPNYRHELDTHLKRKLTSAHWIWQLMHNLQPENILVVGEVTDFDYALRDIGVLPNKPLKGTDFELRHRFPFEDNSFDFLINMEVVEHIKDQDDSDRAWFNRSGLNNFFSELYRIMKPGGHMFLTTPNACSAKNLVRVLMLKTPLSWFNHVREFSPWELWGELTRHGFEIEAMDTAEIFEDRGAGFELDLNFGVNSKIVTDFLTQNGFRTDFRNELLMTCVRKPL